MSERRLASLAMLIVSASALAADPHELLSHADSLRAEWNDAKVTLRVSTTKPGGPPSATELEVAVKGGTKSRIRFLDPADEGKLFLTVDDDAWLLLPKTKNPIKVPKSHRLSGGFAAADVSRTRYAEDYDAVFERSDVQDGHPCSVLRLIERKDRHPSYPVIRVWVDDKERIYRKAVFLVASGRTAKETTFDSYRKYHGILAVEKMTIVDALKPGTTVVEYLDYEKAAFPDSLFDPKTAREAR